MKLKPSITGIIKNYKDNNINAKKKINKNFRNLVRWLRTNINKEDILNQLYYIIFVLRKIEVDKNIDKTQKVELFEFIDYIFKENLDLYSFEPIIKYKKDIDFFIKLNIIKSNLIDLDDLNISFLPNFLEYKHYLYILVWITFCKVNSKKSDKKNSFLYDIYLFQNEQNKRFKIEFLIIVLEKMMNYIHYHDYKKLYKN